MEPRLLLIQYLSLEHSTDYWSDEGIDHAIKLANAMSESAWLALENERRNLSTPVQIKLAEIASEVPRGGPAIIRMLLSMLSSNAPDVVEASVDSLNSIYQLTPDRIAPQQLDRALASVQPPGHLISLVLDSLRRRLAEQLSHPPAPKNLSEDHPR